MEQRITPQTLRAFAVWLAAEERSPATIEKYLRDAARFRRYLAGCPVSKESLLRWKEHLLTEEGCAPVTVNSMLAAVHQLFRCMGRQELRVSYVREQRRIFREPRRELTRQDYQRLLDAARSHRQERLSLLLETMASTGIRVSEVHAITVEAARAGCAEIALKGKLRRILLPKRLCRKLLKYAEKQKTASGEIFLTKGGRGLDRRRIWAELKALARRAGVEASRVFPHNLRHLFAVTFHKACGDIAKLADVLGHASIETTRIYLISSGTEHERLLERLGLVT